MLSGEMRDQIVNAIYELTDEQRRVLFDDIRDIWCTACGYEVPAGGCHCQNDT